MGREADLGTLAAGKLADLLILDGDPAADLSVLESPREVIKAGRILDGDWAILDHSREPRPGSIVAAYIDGKSTLKRFLIRQGKPYLKAENPRYPDLIPCEELMVQGVFIGLYRRG